MGKQLPLSPLIAGTMKWGKWGANFSTTQYRQLIDWCMLWEASTGHEVA
jgi:hypothetical protein